MATYREIQDEVQRKHGQSVKTCWIAHVKELNGLSPRMAVNRLSPLTRKYPCLENMRLLIEESMRCLGVLK
jgi:hypothetical protein